MISQMKKKTNGKTMKSILSHSHGVPESIDKLHAQKKKKIKTKYKWKKTMSSIIPIRKGRKE